MRKYKVNVRKNLPYSISNSLENFQFSASMRKSKIIIDSVLIAATLQQRSMSGQKNCLEKCKKKKKTKRDTNIEEGETLLAVWRLVKRGARKKLASPGWLAGRLAGRLAGGWENPKATIDFMPNMLRSGAVESNLILACHVNLTVPSWHSACFHFILDST